MAVSEKQKQYRNKWDKANMKLVACKIKKEYADEFMKYAVDKGTTVNALLKDYVYKCIGKS
ncbi:MAG: hypothetical protein ACI4DP_06990 [Candidatus Ornithomonoglobus sp.]